MKPSNARAPLASFAVLSAILLGACGEDAPNTMVVGSPTGAKNPTGPSGSGAKGAPLPLPPGPEMVIEGETKLTGTSILIRKARVIFMPEGKLVVPPGAQLTIEANEVIGYGANINIVGPGDPGPPAAAGAACDDCWRGDYNAPTLEKFNQAKEECTGGRAFNLYGHKGATGNMGGAGAEVVIKARAVRGIVECNLPGAKGPGGPGGPGRRICFNGCKVVEVCKAGDKGDDGPKGPDGHCRIEDW